jgi:GH25 family lysozyme M1 (1,4-beta-N-acetylmuramidase)
MTQAPLYADISLFQGNVSWPEYTAWARSFDGTARVCMKATEGVGFIDSRFEANRTEAMAAGVEQIIYYHFARPDLGNSAIAEADYFQRVVGSIRENDLVMLDYELTKPQFTSEWAFEWLSHQEANYGGKPPTFYSYDAYIRERMQDARLAVYPLILANWQYTPNERPPCPPPWKEYLALQYSDKATIPGIAGPVDADVYLHVGSSLPLSKAMRDAGWTSTPHTLVAPNHIAIPEPFASFMLARDWDPTNIPIVAVLTLDSLEQGNPSLGRGAQLICTRTVLEVPEKTGKVQEMFCGKELIAERASTAKIYAALQQAQQTIAQLQSSHK